MSNDPLEQYRWIDDFLQGILSEEDSLQLAQTLETDSEKVRLLDANTEADFLLREMAYTKKHILPKQIPNSVELDRELDQCLQEWSRHDIPEPKHDISKPVEPGTDDVKPIKEKSSESVIDFSDWDKLITMENSVKPKLRLPEPQPKPVHEKHATPSVQQNNSPLRLIITTVILFLLIGSAEWFDSYCQKQRRISVAIPGKFVQVVDLLNVQWRDNYSVLKRGQYLGVNEYALEKGSVYLQYDTGTELILKGPVRFTLTDEHSIFCAQGEVNAHVPPSAIGFAVKTPRGTFVDRGTDFSVVVDSQSDTVEVFQGRVDAYHSNEEPLVLTKGMAVSRAVGESWKKQIADSLHYFSTKLFSKELDKELLLLRNRQKEKEANLRQDSGIKLLCNLWDIEKGAVVSQIGNQIGRFGGTLSEGRYKGTHSLYFGDRSDRLLADVNHSCSSMTILISVRLDRLAHVGNVLVMSDYFDALTGKISWQINKEGKLMFYISNDSGNIETNAGQIGFDSFTTSVCYSNHDWGTWAQLAVVVDAKNRQILQYKDGKLLSRQPWQTVVPLDPGKLNIGNATTSLKGSSSRYLGGMIDEFIIWDRALSAGEIASLSQD